MSLKYGLNVKSSKAPPAPRKAIFDDEEEDEQHDVPPPPTRKSGPSAPGKPPSGLKKLDDSREDASSISAAAKQVKAAEEVDASIFDYDSFHSAKESVTVAKKEAARQEAIERKPKYINNLLDAAARRKQDQLIAREKLLQKEREAEGDEFADKEKFVTGAYKEHQEEARRLEEEEKKKTELEEKRKRAMGGSGMQGFYRTMMDQTERQHQEAVEAAAKLEKEGGVKPEASGEAMDGEEKRTSDLRAKGVHLNEEGQIIDKRELLSAGLNIAPKAGKSGAQGADHLKARPATQSAFPKKDIGGQQASRERQTKMMEEQLEAQRKRAREEEEEERVRLENTAKSQKTESAVSDAKARYLARKAAKERGEG